MSEEPEKSISTQLREAREKRGVSLEEVKRRTGVSLDVLHGLEEDRYDVVEPVFTRMALRTYAEYLGMEDVEALLKRYDSERGQAVERVRIKPPPVAAPPSSRRPLDTAALRVIGLAVVALVALFLVLYFIEGDEEPAKPASGSALPQPPRTRRLPDTFPAEREQMTAADRIGEERPAESATDTLAAAIPPPPEGGGTLAEAEIASRSDSSAAEAAPAPVDTAGDQVEAIAADLPLTDENAGASTPADEAAATTPAIADSAVAIAADESLASAIADTATAVPPPLAANTAGDSLLTLEVEAIDPTWVEIRGDGRFLFQGTLPKGERRTWQARDFFFVHSGRAYGLRYWLDGQLLGNGRLGEETRVLRFRVDAEGVILLGPDMQPLEPAAPAAGEGP